MWTTAMRRWTRKHPLLADLAMVGVVLPVTLIAFGAGFSEPLAQQPTALDGFLAAAATLPLLARRRAPFWVLGLVAAVCTVAQVSSGVVAPLVTPLSIALYSAAARTDRRRAWTAAGLTTVCTLVPAVFWAPGLLFGPLRLGAITWIGCATALGVSARDRRAFVAALEERALRAERTRDEEAARRVTEERMRIARELHDVVAHELTLITTQTGVSIHLGQRDPEILVGNMTSIREHSRRALHELRAVVGLLTQPGDGAAPREPVPGLDQLGELVASFKRGGLDVEIIEEGERHPLPPSVDLAAFRILQEALTNVRKHGGGGPARVRVRFGRDALRITVTNERTAAAPPQGDGPLGGNGRGLISIRERAAAVGGQVTMGPSPEGGFNVETRLPFVRSMRPAAPANGVGR